MAITRGETAIWRIPILDTSGNPLDLSGCTFTTTAVGADAVTLFTNTIVVAANGTVTSATNMALESTAAAGVIIETIPSEQTATFPVGSYTLTGRIELADGSDYYPFDAETLIVQAASVPSTTTSVHGVSRASIRRSVARMLSDLYTATATRGDTGSMVDTRAFARESNHFKGMQVLFTNPTSANYGQVTTVTQSDGPTRTVYFEPPLPTPVVAGDTVEMYNFRSRGTTVDQYNGAINDAISAARQQHALIPTSYTATSVFDRSSPYMDIPQDFVSIATVETTMRNGRKYRLKPGEFTVDRMSRSIDVTRHSAASRIHGLTLTIRGYTQPELLDDDNDTTLIDTEWLYSEVKAQILERMTASGMPVGTQDRLYLQERQEAGGKRNLIIPRAVPNTIRLY